MSLISGDEVKDLRSKFHVIENFVEPEFFKSTVGGSKVGKIVSFIGRVVGIK
ncbi:hypothetical protein JGI25_01117, partial [Candidatus Kryptobacter tengchongensis]